MNYTTQDRLYALLTDETTGATTMDTLRPYLCELRRYAGDPVTVRVVVDAVNRRHAETLAAQYWQGLRLEDVSRKTKP